MRSLYASPIMHTDAEVKQFWNQPYNRDSLSSQGIPWTSLVHNVILQRYILSRWHRGEGRLKLIYSSGASPCFKSLHLHLPRDDAFQSEPFRFTSYLGGYLPAFYPPSATPDGYTEIVRLSRDPLRMDSTIRSLYHFPHDYAPLRRLWLNCFLHPTQGTRPALDSTQRLSLPYITDFAASTPPADICLHLVQLTTLREVRLANAVSTVQEVNSLFEGLPELERFSFSYIRCVCSN
jgi:hypothetical protein